MAILLYCYFISSVAVLPWSMVTWFVFFYPHSFDLSLPKSCTIFLSHTLFISPSLAPLSLSHTHTFLSLSLSFSLSLSLSFSLYLSLSLTQKCTLSLSLSLSLSLFLTHTNSLTHSLSLSLSISLFQPSWLLCGYRDLLFLKSPFSQWLLIIYRPIGIDGVIGAPLLLVGSHKEKQLLLI